MLQGSFYDILQSNPDGYVIRFKPAHPIFSGHFPEYPVVPGACVVQIAEELATISIGYPVRFAAIRDLKFRQPITPDQEITINISKTAESICKVLCTGSKNEQQLIISFSAQYDSLTL